QLLARAEPFTRLDEELEESRVVGTTAEVGVQTRRRWLAGLLKQPGQAGVQEIGAGDRTDVGEGNLAGDAEQLLGVVQRLGAKLFAGGRAQGRAGRGRRGRGQRSGSQKEAESCPESAQGTPFP